MVKYETQNSETAVRSMLEGLMTLNDESSVDQIVHSKAQCKAIVDAKVLDTKLTGKLAGMKITLTWTKNTGFVQVQTGPALEDRARDIMVALDRVYAELLETGKVLPAPRGSEQAAGTFRVPASHGFKEQADTVNDTYASGLTPQTEELKQAIRSVAEVASSNLESYPEWKERLLAILASEFGLVRELDEWMPVAKVTSKNAVGPSRLKH
jgi:hypothetical protein